MADGLTVPFALAAGLTGTIDSTRIIVMAGLAEIAAGSIAMGLGGYLAARSDAEHYDGERVREEREVIEVPDVEAREVAEVFYAYGLNEAQTEPIVQALRDRPDAWVDFMMRFELGLATPPSKPLEISRRYLAASLRRLQWAWGQFKKGRHDVNLDAPPPRFELGPHRQFDPSTEIIVPPRESMPARADAPPAVAEIKAPAANPEPVADPIVVDAAPVKPTELPTAPVVPTRPMSPGVPDDRLIANRHQRRAERSEARRHNSA
jgi:hypothetical protein